LRTLGFHTVGELSATPRAPLTLRFGPQVGRRLDQMFGRVAEPIDPVRGPEIMWRSPSFRSRSELPKPSDKYIGLLVVKLCEELQKKGLGVRRTDLIVHRVDNTIQSMRAGTAKPVRDIPRLTKLL
jgi:protein ImuB